MPEDSKPSWLGASIYDELSNPGENLEGTFTTYLQLIDDLDYSTTLARTGSKTIFPANDEAFARFFQDNSWGVRSYADLSYAQKKLLLYSSMLDNAILLGMLPNVSNGSNDVVKGQALKHATNVSIIDSVTKVSPDLMPANNSYWKKYAEKIKNHQFYAVYDATTPMMVHFTREQMINNNITTAGDESDFSILTGSPYTDGTAYVFRNKIIHGDVTCQNGYIHQMQDVLVPPGNMAEVLRTGTDTKLFSRILNYFSAPYYNKTVTDNYNDWALTYGYPTVDSIFQVRYLSKYSQGSSLNRDPYSTIHSNSEILAFDPGWNAYYPSVSSSSGIDYTIADIGAMFVPTDDALWNYFRPDGGNGAYIVDVYGEKPNTKDNLPENLDSIFSKKPNILTAFVNNLMKSSFVSTVPSKFDQMTNDASEIMGMSTEKLQKSANGYDIIIANNGVVYKLNEFIVPDEYQSVMAPASVYQNMKVMNVFIQDHSQNGNASVLGADMYFYLMAMKANYAFFIPTDAAFENYYIDPTTWEHANTEALKFYYDASKSGTIKVYCDRYVYDKKTGIIGEKIGERINAEDKKTQIKDLLDCHTIVLNEGGRLSNRNFYVTKNGAALKIKCVGDNKTIYGGLQIDKGIDYGYATYPASEVEETYTEKNGQAFRVDHVIQPTINSVYNVLKTNSDKFTTFMEVCEGFGNDALLEWAGITSGDPTSGIASQQDRYQVFIEKKGIDYNVNFLSSYNYTLYAPNESAMKKAFALGLPTWKEIEALYEPYKEKSEEEEVTPEEAKAKALALEKINTIRSFIRYQFQNNSIFADTEVDGGKYQTLLTDELGISQGVTVSGGNNILQVTDSANVTHTIKADGALLVNEFARDYQFNSDKKSATSIVASSYVIVHEIEDALNFNSKLRYDNAWATAKAVESLVANYRARVQQINNKQNW